MSTASCSSATSTSLNVLLSNTVVYVLSNHSTGYTGEELTGIRIWSTHIGRPGLIKRVRMNIFDRIPGHIMFARSHSEGNLRAKQIELLTCC